MWLLLPIALPIGLLIQLLPFKKTQDRTAEEVAGYIGDFLNGDGGDWDWDDFTTVPITDAELEKIREGVNSVHRLPSEEVNGELEALRLRAVHIARARSAD